MWRGSPTGGNQGHQVREQAGQDSPGLSLLQPIKRDCLTRWTYFLTHVKWDLYSFSGFGNMKKSTHMILLAFYRWPNTVIFRVKTMDKGAIKTKNPKCRLNWCLIEFVDRSTVSHVGIFDPLLWTVVLPLYQLCTLSALYLLSDLPHPSPPSESKRTVETAYFNRSLIVMCEYIVNKSANGLGGKNPGIMCREKNPPVCI